MTATVTRLRPRRSAGPCISGTVPGQVSPSCGKEPTRLHAAGPLCAAHPPPSTATLRATSLLKPWRGAA